MRRQTRLTPAEGGRFAGPVGSPVPPNAADMGRATDEQVDAANGTMRRLGQMLEEHGCEMVANEGWCQWVIIKGDRVLMRIGRAQVELARLEETRAIVEEVLRREAATREDMLEMLDDARNSERLVQAELDMMKRAALGDSEMIKHLRDQNAALVRERDSLAAELRALRKEHNALAVENREMKTRLVQIAKHERAEQAVRRMERNEVRTGQPVGLVSERAEGRKEVGRLEDITGGPVVRDGVPMLGGIPFIPSDEIPDGRTIYALPKEGEREVLIDCTSGVTKLVSVPKCGPGALEEVQKWKARTGPPVIVADPPFSYQQEFKGRDLMKEYEQTRRESKEVLQRAFDHAYSKKEG